MIKVRKLPGGFVEAEYFGMKHTFSYEELELAFRAQEYLYRCGDAECKILEFFSVGSLEDLCDEDRKAAETLMEKIPELVELFEKRFDCNLAENDIWRDIIEAYLI